MQNVDEEQYFSCPGSVCLKVMLYWIIVSKMFLDGNLNLNMLAWLLRDDDDDPEKVDVASRVGEGDEKGWRGRNGNIMFHFSLSCFTSCFKPSSLEPDSILPVFDLTSKCKQVGFHPFFLSTRRPMIDVFVFQGRSLLNASLMAATGSLPIAVTERNTPMSTPVTSHISAKSEAVISPTRTPALCENTWRSTANPHHLLLSQDLMGTSPWGQPWVPLFPHFRTQEGVSLPAFLLRSPISMNGTFARPVGQPTTSIPHPVMPPLLRRRKMRRKRPMGTLSQELFIRTLEWHTHVPFLFTWSIY